MTTTEALRLAREALTWMPDMAEGGKAVDHLYDGDCPDQLDRTRRDPACPACKAMDKARAALSAIDQAQAAPVGAPSVEPVCDERATWWSLVMGAAASLEDAAACLRDPDAKRAAEGAAKHYRERAQAGWTGATPQAQPATPPAVQAPLTDEQLCKLRQADNGALNYVTLRQFRVIARATERAHGIGAAAQGDTQ